VSRRSRVPGFHAMPVEERRRFLLASEGLDEASRDHLRRGGCIDLAVADRLGENVVGVHALPLSLAMNFTVNGRDVVVPMAVEEPSVVAAASFAARMVRSTNDFEGEAAPPEMTAQVHLGDVPEPERAEARLLEARAAIVAAADRAMPRMVERGGGCRDLDLRVLDAADGLVVVHLYLDVSDAMGANVCDAVAEAVAPAIQAAIGGEVLLRILTNLAVRRLVKVGGAVTLEELGGPDVARRVARASRLAELDPYRAVTHNKGFLNGVDAAALACGQDWRAIEAAAHGWAALGAGYRPLTSWRVEGDRLAGRAELPLAVGIAGGCAEAHPGARAALQIVGARSSGELAVILASVGLASNLAALRALATEGIQRGHMRLHQRRNGT